MSFDIDTCKFCVWGFHSSLPYDTFRHIHEAFYRALLYKFPTRSVSWLDNQDSIAGIDFDNTFFITMNYGVDGIPVRDDCFYAVHNIEEKAQTLLAGKAVLDYGVFTSETGRSGIELAKDTYQNGTTVVFRWGTDLLPHEIQANKPCKVFNQDSRVINYVGTNAGEYRINISRFAQAAWEGGILLRPIGGLSGEPVSIEENVRLIKESYMAPALCIPWQLGAGMIPCRVFKNISYGQFPITNSLVVKNFLNGNAIQNEDSRQLFFDAQRDLKYVPLKELHALMDEVAKHHTYLNKIDALLTATRNLL
jgi:hypothetical protein